MIPTRTRAWIAAAALLAALSAGCEGNPLVAKPLAPPIAPAVAPAQEALDLRTETAEEGFALAVELARRSVTTTQPDPEVLAELRAAYARDPALLIDSSGVVAEFFATVAAANDYWREE